MACNEDEGCDELDCKNGGECVVSVLGVAFCDCPPNYYGELCESFDACYGIRDTCITNSSCEDGLCVCNLGYEGANCDTEFLAKYLGNYRAFETCRDSLTQIMEGISDFDCLLLSDDRAATQLLMQNQQASETGYVTQFYLELLDNDTRNFVIPAQHDSTFRRSIESLTNGVLGSLGTDTIRVNYLISLEQETDTLLKICDLILIR